MQKRTFILLKYSLILIILFHACNKDEVLEKVLNKRTVIIYMAADNNLSDDAYANLEEIKQGFKEKDTKLIIFIDPADYEPQILEISPSGSKIVKTYQELNSAYAVKMKSVLSDIIGLYPAREYGLVLWSHGSSWLPADSRLRSFGNDKGKQMNIPDLANSLPVKFSFILFDACLMGSVEVAYELKDKTDYIIPNYALAKSGKFIG